MSGSPIVEGLLNRDELLDFHGISRSVLEARIVDLVKQLEMALKRVAELEHPRCSGVFGDGDVD